MRALFGGTRSENEYAMDLQGKVTPLRSPKIFGVIPTPFSASFWKARNPLYVVAGPPKRDRARRSVPAF